jgi:putative Mn2+ efflux pump MntP
VRQLLVIVGLLFPLALDTFAIAAALGIAGLQAAERTRVALIFTAFEAGMPILGLAAGRLTSGLLGPWSGYVAIAILAGTGLLMVRPGRDEDDEERRLRLLAHARGAAVIGLGISVSLDELTIGLSAGLLGLPIALVVVWIAVQAFAAAQVGLRFGARIGEAIRERAEQMAGLALLALAAILLVLEILKV